MRAYQTIRFTEGPDCGDLAQEGRKSSVGNIAGKSGHYRSHSRGKKATRRYLKRADRARALRFALEN
jgi:hypothetical protein